MKRIAGLLVLAALSFGTAAAQTLPQSTQDRQAIANLEYQANLPGTSPATRAQIQQQISELQYRINTRPLIQPMPTLPPTWQQQPGLSSSLPHVSAKNTVPMTATVYGSCDADKAVLAYLQEQVKLPSTTTDERNYDRQRIGNLQREIAKERC